MSQGRNAGSDMDGGSNGTANRTGNRTVDTRLRNLYGSSEECDLWVHLSLNGSQPPLGAVLDEARGASAGLQLLWHERVRYEESPAPSSKNVSVGPFSEEVLNGTVLPFVHATLLRTELLEGGLESIPPHQVVTQSLALVAMLRELRPAEQAGSLFAGEDDPPRPVLNMSAVRLPYFKTKVEVRPVFDQSRRTKHRHNHQCSKVLADFWGRRWTPLLTFLSAPPLAWDRVEGGRARRGPMDSARIYEGCCYACACFLFFCNRCIPRRSSKLLR
ncbi:unnamed protein product [Prorocentrum cordatum]|uniref:Uncharacterized protein n=1 Tax=Prorocentrum cordatum TaxID=2364126 RepID=A0ABN9XGT3_9DINO|nr:unnamed protein product [Polarella glacialis]